MKAVVPRVPSAPLERIVEVARREGMDIRLVRVRLEEMAAALLDHNGARCWMPHPTVAMPKTLLVPDEVAAVLNERFAYGAPYLLAHAYPALEVSRLCEKESLESALESVLRLSRLHRLP